MGERVSRAELARRLGLNEASVRKHLAKGLYKLGPDKKVDFEDAKAAWIANRDPDAVIKGALGGAAVAKGGRPETLAAGETTLSRTRAAHTALRVQKEKLQLDKARGRLIDRDAAMDASLAVASVIKERIEGAASQIAVRVAGVSSVPECERIARDVLRGVLAELAGLAQSVQEVADAGA